MERPPTSCIMCCTIVKNIRIKQMALSQRELKQSHISTILSTICYGVVKYTVIFSTLSQGESRPSVIQMILLFILEDCQHN